MASKILDLVSPTKVISSVFSFFSGVIGNKKRKSIYPIDVDENHEIAVIKKVKIIPREYYTVF